MVWVLHARFVGAMTSEPNRVYLNISVISMVCIFKSNAFQEKKFGESIDLHSWRLKDV